MLHQAVICSTLGLALASVFLFVAGHRLRRGHWFASLGASAFIWAAAAGMQAALNGSGVPLGWAVVTAVLVTAVTAASFEKWNAAGHAAFAAVSIAVVVFLAYVGYVIWAAKLGPWSLTFAILLLVAQAGALVLLVSHTFEIVDVVCRTGWRRVAGAQYVAGYAPMVSLHVPTHNEPPELVIETLDALARLDYPNFEVLIIDNNTADEELWRPVQQHCAKLGVRFRFFHLMPWPGYKSGALNFAGKQVDPRTEIIGVVDADYLVEPNYLRDLIGFFAEPRIAFVQTPQDYRDGNDRGRYGRALYLSYQYFFKVSMATRNEYNAIIFAGTMGLIRRSALQEVGGWDEWCITEDAEVALRLLDAGYQSFYIDQTYGRGMMPLDYAGLKKQRFRWAFGGIQLLRMHAPRLLNPWWPGKLTQAQRWAFLSGGLQWLNDPLTLFFTVVLLIGSSALLLGGSFYLQPLVGAAIFAPLLFILFAVMRFLWAFRVRVKCSWREAFDGLTVLLGLTWVVTLACVRGLFSREGVFLRTPKQGERPRLTDSARIVGWEFGLAATCIALAVALVVQQREAELSARSVVILLLLWQWAMYFSAVRTSLWSYRAGLAAVPRSQRFSFRSVGPAIGRFLTERPIATWVVAGAIFTGIFFYIAQLLAPLQEQIMRADPRRQFLQARSVLPPRPEEVAGGLLVLEADAAKKRSIEDIVSLWDPEGVVVDRNFTPDDPADDRVWRGIAQVQNRYRREFRLRKYHDIRHDNLRLKQTADGMVVTNDLHAVYETASKVRRVRLRETDQWTFRERDGQWRIARLEVNRARMAPRVPRTTNRRIE